MIYISSIVMNIPIIAKQMIKPLLSSINILSVSINDSYYYECLLFIKV
jgi:hypothetical protein